MNDPQLDMHMRKTALDAALKHLESHHYSPEEVVKVATQFYQFLKGDTK
jgi:hypothetical protein